jgi:dienelactone hydrolase
MSQCVLGVAALAFFNPDLHGQGGAAPVISQGNTATKTDGAIATLPAPAGVFGVGRIGYEWIDDTVPATSRAPRDLMVYLWYPSAKTTAEYKGVYLPSAKQIDADPAAQPLAKEEFGGAWGQIVSGKLKSHAQENAPVARSLKAFPVVVFSHGAGGTGFEYTALIEDLVSHGYLVAMIEHTGTALAVVFPNGRIITQHHDSVPAGLTPEQRFQRMMESSGNAISEGAGDVVFVLNKLRSLNRSAEKSFPLGGRLDLTRVAAAGHSAGGAFAVRACQLDARFGACLSFDGALPPVSAFPEFPDKKRIQQPVMLLEVDHTGDRMPFSPEQYNDFLKTKDAELKLCPPGSYDVLLKAPALYHGSFSDWRLLAASGQTPETEQALHNLNLIESFTRAFLGKTLRHTKEPVLDSPSNSSEATVKEYGS